MDFMQLLQERYTCKHYDPNRPLTSEELNRILEAGRLSPSAVNLQPWRFIVIDTPEGKEQIMPGIMETNRERIKNVPCVVVVCARTENPDADVEAVLNAEEHDGRFPDPEAKAAQRKGRKHFSDLHLQDAETWNAKQCYIAMATMCYAPQSMGIDSTPVEGVFFDKIDEILKLRDKGLASQLLIFFGHRVPEDTNQLKFRPKSRLPLKDLMVKL